MASFCIFHIAQQRLAYLSWLIACSIILLLSVRSKFKWIAFATLLFAFIIIIFISPKIQDRIEQAHNEFISYDYKNNYTSVGMRLHMWFKGLESVSKSPISGHGLGSYPIVASNNFNDPVMCEVACRHPHNQYIFYTLEFGLIGLSIFLISLFLIFIKLSFQSYYNFMPFSLLLVLITVSFGESTLWYRGFVYLFIPLLALSISSTNLHHDRNINESA